MSAILTTLSRQVFGKTSLLSIFLTALLSLSSVARAYDYVMTTADYDKERARVAKLYTEKQKEEMRVKLARFMDIPTFEELNLQAEDVWNNLIHREGSLQRALVALQQKKTPPQVLQFSQELSNFLASSDANFQEIINRGSVPILKMHPLLVHLLAATITSKGITVILETRPGFFESPLFHPLHIQTLLMTVMNKNGHNSELKKSSEFTKQEARTMLLAMGILSLLDTSSFYALDYGTLHWLRLFIAQDFNSLADNRVGVPRLYFVLTGTIPGLTSTESTLDMYNMTQDTKKSRMVVAEKLTGYDYETFLRYMDRLSAGKER
ncbi:hypothetical protein [Bdellovibrio sp. HCB2-146]|uniref:hypothetical protein n=1 Tax=Bdellovibrio sp. HCB2-146 TaxID=3394362 RepID=UPI0039BC3EF7